MARIFRNAIEHARCQTNEADDDFEPHGPPERPTHIQPGTREKVEVLAQRFEDGLELWHPQDRHCHAIGWEQVHHGIMIGCPHLVGLPGQPRKEIDEDDG